MASTYSFSFTARIVTCCNTWNENLDSNNVLITLNNADPATFVEGLYKANETSTFTYTVPGGGGSVATETINEGQCYFIGGPSTNSPTVAGELDFDTLDFMEAGIGFSPGADPCKTYDTLDCSCPWLYYISPCCREFGYQDAAAQQVNLSLSDIPYEDGTYIYGGTSFVVPGTNLTLEQNQCYTFTRILQEEPIQTLIELDFSSSNWQQMNLELGCNDSRCDDCPEEGIAYLKFEPCCEGFDTIYVRTETYTGQESGPAPIVNIVDYLGVFVYNGTALPSLNSAPFVAGQCYTGTLHTLGTEAAPAPQDEIDYNKLPLAPYSTQLNDVNDCNDPDCPECRPTVYSLTNCEGITINTETDLSAYIGTYIELEDIEGCWFVQEYSAVNEIKDPSAIIGGKLAASNQLINTLPGLQTQPVTVTGPCDGCDCICYEVIGYSGTFTYIDCETGNTVLVTSSGADKFCAATAPTIVGVEGEDYTLVIGEDCIEGECIEQCFLLTNCEPEQHPDQDPVLTSNLQSLSQYANGNSVVVLAGYEGCWTVTVTEECDCPIDVTVIQDYIDCEACLPTRAYKLTSCANPLINAYTTQDLSEYVDKVIKDDCDCYTVQEIDYQPPIDTPITIDQVYDDCETCQSEFFILTDCNNADNIIITNTNLILYVGQYIKIQNCNFCFFVESYTEVPTFVEAVTVEENFATCFDCNQVPPRCSTVFNNSTEDRAFTYIDVNGNPQLTEVVKSGHFSLRYCVQEWNEPDSFIFNFYGDCTVFESVSPTEDCDCFNLRITDLNGDTFTYLAVHTGEFYNTDKVWDVTINDFEYKIWTTNSGAGGWACSAVVGGSFNITDPTVLGTIKSAVLDCPAGESESNPVVWQGGTIPGASSKAGSIVAPGGLISFVADCPDLLVTKYAHCVQHFPNKRKVKPGYNTPICSADKYDKITCNFADIAYKKVLELRYGISNCCPEEDEKWLIKKELIELQALTDPDYTCDQIADCCGNSTSHCSCNS